MRRLLTNLTLASLALFALAVFPRHWLTGGERELGLLTERVCAEGTKTCEVHSLATLADGWWPLAGTVAFGSALVVAAALVVGWLSRQRAFGHLAMLASAVALGAGLAFVLGRPSALAATYSLNMGPVLMLLATLFGLLTGRIMARGEAAIPGQASRAG